LEWKFGEDRGYLDGLQYTFRYIDLMKLLTGC